ncbi:hypothetical protein [Rhodoferax ferrireducens]|uniref:hypothetical protein n=1 Tax=Rhodoferax ferrireducens TaxID=192843 RepID=UPI0013008F3C|nr:hypothetical protein [Rhodoferax ferrireducens]
MHGLFITFPSPYLTAVIDLFSRQVVGWRMRDHIQAQHNAPTGSLPGNGRGINRSFW